MTLLTFSPARRVRSGNSSPKPFLLLAPRSLTPPQAKALNGLLVRLERLAQEHPHLATAALKAGDVVLRSLGA